MQKQQSDSHQCSVDANLGGAVLTAPLVVTTRIDAGQTGRWEDLFIVSLDRPGENTVIASSASLTGAWQRRC
jgi:hypothetical protein